MSNYVETKQSISRNREKIFQYSGKANTFNLFGPKAWAPQTDYNPVLPGSDKPEQIDMRPKAVEAREKEARKALVLPVVAIAGVVLVLAAAILIKKFS